MPSSYTSSNCSENGMATNTCCFGRPGACLAPPHGAMPVATAPSTDSANARGGGRHEAVLIDRRPHLLPGTKPWLAQTGPHASLNAVMPLRVFEQQRVADDLGDVPFSGRVLGHKGNR